MAHCERCTAASALLMRLHLLRVNAAKKPCSPLPVSALRPVECISSARGSESRGSQRRQRAAHPVSAHSSSLDHTVPCCRDWWTSAGVADPRWLPLSRCSARSAVLVLTLRCSVCAQPSQKTFRIKQKLAKKAKQNRPIPQWIRFRTDNSIR